ncbi:protein of unknown function [Brochothrix thermosphacta]|uniref:Uncharacterized protein n=1 Tax=Brochothrix thermosphacta TaxID=2756 RepID=A0A2X0Q1B8_BROTH|nr:hypothetical protein BTH160X_100120 [Brochothrix thermosphacta]SPN72772.1 protein of unknown function [Brochothrix thermosphacta]SPP29112.1 hypothetical protein BTBSAS_40135 [Brochothrix thermosphacta]SPP30133.1 hypothetical protein BTTAP_60136 [Brochothrix thermosphacta]
MIDNLIIAVDNSSYYLIIHKKTKFYRKNLDRTSFCSTSVHRLLIIF